MKRVLTYLAGAALLVAPLLVNGQSTQDAGSAVAICREGPGGVAPAIGPVAFTQTGGSVDAADTADTRVLACGGGSGGGGGGGGGGGCKIGSGSCGPR